MANTATPVQTSTTTWNIDPAHTAAEFKVKHMMIANVKGAIKDITGDLSEHTTATDAERAAWRHGAASVLIHDRYGRTHDARPISGSRFSAPLN